jgi:hypothetical protein
MKPTEFDGHNVVYGANQPEYNPLPAHKDQEGTVTTCWELDEVQLMKIQETGKVYLQQLTFNKALQPVKLSIDKPELNP